MATSSAGSGPSESELVEAIQAAPFAEFTTNIEPGSIRSLTCNTFADEPTEYLCNFHLPGRAESRLSAYLTLDGSGWVLRYLGVAALSESPTTTPLAEAEGFLEFSRGHSLSFDHNTVTSGIIRAQTGGWHYWFRLNTQVGDSITIQWTDTARCPQARALLESTTNLAPPRIDIPGISNLATYVGADGSWYEIRVSANSDHHVSELSFGSGNGSALGQWVDESLATLEQCWSDEPPEGYRSE